MLERSAERYGKPLAPSGIQAYCPPILEASQALSAAPARSGTLPAEQAALALAEAMSQTPAAVTDEIFAEARRYYTDAQLVELAATAALENYRARFNCAFGVESHNLYHAPVEAGGAE